MYPVELGHLTVVCVPSWTRSLDSGLCTQFRELRLTKLCKSKRTSMDNWKKSIIDWIFVLISCIYRTKHALRSIVSFIVSLEKRAWFWAFNLISPLFQNMTLFSFNVSWKTSSFNKSAVSEHSNFIVDVIRDERSAEKGCVRSNTRFTHTDAHTHSQTCLLRLSTCAKPPCREFGEFLSNNLQKYQT